jgi:dipeptide transport system ATP-binding protein
MTPILSARNLSRYYNVSRGLFAQGSTLKALDGVSFDLFPGKTLAVVGESGCGKSTLARLVTMIEQPTSGELTIAGTRVATVTPELRPRVQIVFQNPYGSLNPRQKIGHALEEPLLVNTNHSSSERTERARAMLASVGLRPEHYDRYPHMFSGGQRQRIAIARALMLDPEILVLDEPVSALDLSVQAQVLNLLAELQQRLNLSYLFISHDLSVVRHIADEVMVMYLGKTVEHGSRDIIFKDPKHPYTQALLSATPVADPEAKKNRIVLKGELPSPLNPPQGCPFHPRCPIAEVACKSWDPKVELKHNRSISCRRV